MSSVTSKQKMLCGFCERSSTFVSVSHDNRLKVWRTEEIKGGGPKRRKGNERTSLKHEFYEPSLSTKFTSLAVGEDISGDGGGGEAKQQTDQTSTHSATSLVALGTSVGTIIVWDLTKAEVKWRLGENLTSSSDSHGLQVTSVAFNGNASILYSASRDKTIRQWNMQSGKLSDKWSSGKNTISSLQVSPDDSMLISASATIKVWDLSSKKALKRMTGHSTSVSCIDISSDGTYFTSGASDRYVIFWDAKSRKREALCNFVLDSYPVAVKIDKLRQASNVYRVLCVSDSGKVSIFEFDSSKRDSKNSPKSLLKCEISSKSAKHPIVNARFATEDSVVVARVDGLQPVFQKVSYIKDGSFIDTQLETLKTGSLLPSGKPSFELSKKRKLDRGSVTILGPADSALPAPQQQQSRHKRRKTDPVMMKIAEITGTAERKGLPKPDSLQLVLVQGLKTLDSELIEYCLQQKSKHISTTIQRLPTAWVLPLLKELKQRFVASPDRVHLIEWIKMVLNIHTSYLISVPELSPTLSELCQLIDARLSVHNKILKLHGRLEMITSQIDLQASKMVENPPENVYIEGEDDEDPNGDAEMKSESLTNRNSIEGVESDGEEDDQEMEDVEQEESESGGEAEDQSDVGDEEEEEEQEDRETIDKLSQKKTAQVDDHENDVEEVEDEEEGSDDEDDESDAESSGSD